MRTLSGQLNRISRGWVALAVTLVFALFVALVLPGQSRSSATAGAEIGSPDLSFWYAPDDLYRMAEAYGPAGRSEYVRARWSFDVVWPLVYVAFLSVTLAWTWGRRLAGLRLGRRANLLPVAAGAFDLLENACTSLVMLRYPARTPGADLLAPISTLLKWAFLSVSFALLVVGLAWVVGRWVRGRTTKAS